MDWEEWQRHYESKIGFEIEESSVKEFEQKCKELFQSYNKEYDVVEKVLEIFWEKENEAQRDIKTVD